MVECGADWLKAFRRLAPTAIVLTHGHGDHAFGLADGAPCPVYATEETWALIDKFPIAARRTVSPRKSFRIGSVRFEAFPVEHSLRAPAVGYRVMADRKKFFYVPDVATIPDQRAALRSIDLYVGDGATVVRSMVWQRDHTLIGHASIAAQLDWCADEKVSQAIFTHCGSEIVTGDERVLGGKIRRMARERGVRAQVAFDGMERVLRGSGR